PGFSVPDVAAAFMLLPAVQRMLNASDKASVLNAASELATNAASIYEMWVQTGLLDAASPLVELNRAVVAANGRVTTFFNALRRFEVVASGCIATADTLPRKAYNRVPEDQYKRRRVDAPE